MSCLLTSPETISKIANFSEKLLNMGYDFSVSAQTRSFILNCLIVKHLGILTLAKSMPDCAR